MSGSVPRNDYIKLTLSDVDETIADVYTPAEPAMIAELRNLLSEGTKHARSQER